MADDAEKTEDFNVLNEIETSSSLYVSHYGTKENLKRFCELF